MTATLIPLLILLPWASAAIVWAFDDRKEKRIHGFAAAVSLICAAISVLILLNNQAQPVTYYEIGGLFGSLSSTADGLGAALACIANCIGSLAVVFSAEYMKSERSLSRYYAMILLFIGAMSGLVLTANLFLIFFFWEITALCSYQLISFYNDDPNAVRGGLKALWITQLGGVGLLLAALLIFSQTHSFDMNLFLEKALAGEISARMLSVIGFGMIIAAAAKSSQFPFFTWLPDAMEAPTPISALIHAATMVNAGVYLLCRFYPAFAAVPGWKMTVLIVGLITVLISSLMAIVADDLKRVLAYSTVSQLGFMFTAIGAGSVLASQFHLLSHAIFKALLFLAAGAIIHSCGTRDMRKMGGFFKKAPFIGTTFIIGALALAGIPVFNGFWSKELILEAIHTESPLIIYILMLISVILTALYTLRCVWLVFFGKPPSDLHAHDAPMLMAVPLGMLAIGTLTSWFTFQSFSGMLAETLPYHEMEAESFARLVRTVAADPLTYLALGMVAIGILCWVFRKAIPTDKSFFQRIRSVSQQSFGFEALNSGVVHGINHLSESVRTIQTGTLNWNIFGMLAGFILVAVILMIGGR